MIESYDNPPRAATLNQHWTWAARRHGVALQRTAHSSNRREAFASAERLAFWFVDTVGADAPELLRTLTDWRERYGAPLSDDALSLIAAHVLAEAGR